MAKQKANTNYQAAWADLKKWRRIYLGGILGFIPVLFGVSILSRAIQPDQPNIISRYPWVGLLIMVVVVGPAWWAGFKYYNFKCPRCGKSYHELRWPLKIKRCSHCDLREGSDG